MVEEEGIYKDLVHGVMRYDALLERKPALTTGTGEPPLSLHTLNTFVASTVEVLTFAGHRSPIFREPEHLVFPRLEYLTISGPLFYSMCTEANLANGKPVLPALRGLHVQNLPGASPSPQEPTFLLTLTLAHCTPNITHLQITQDTPHDQLVTSLGALMGVPGYRQRVQELENQLAQHGRLSHDNPWRLSHFSNLRLQRLSVVIVHNERAPQGRRCGNNRMPIGQVFMTVQSLVDDIERARSPANMEAPVSGGPRLVVVPPTNPVDDPAQTRRNWEEVIVGALGDWDEEKAS